MRLNYLLEEEKYILQLWGECICGRGAATSKAQLSHRSLYWQWLRLCSISPADCSFLLSCIKFLIRHTLDTFQPASFTLTSVLLSSLCLPRFLDHCNNTGNWNLRWVLAPTHRFVDHYFNRHGISLVFWMRRWVCQAIFCTSVTFELELDTLVGNRVATPIAMSCYIICCPPNRTIIYIMNIRLHWRLEQVAVTINSLGNYLLG